MKYTPRIVSKTITNMKKIKSKGTISDQLIIVWDVEKAIQMVCFDTQKRLIELWMMEYTEEEMAVILGTTVAGIESRKKKIKKKICNYLNGGK